MTPFEERLLDKQDAVLREIAALRVDCEKRFAELEQHDHETYDNGQPGWKTKHEERIAALEAERAEKKGAIGVAGWLWGSTIAVGTVVAEFFIHRR